MPVQRAVSLAVIAALLSLLLFVRVDGNGAWLRVALDGSHVPIFAGVAMLLAALLPRRHDSAPDGPRYLLAFALALGVGAAIEYVQSLTGRPASAFDMASNAAGAAIGIGLLALHRGPRGRRRLTGRAGWVLACAAIVGLVFATWRPLEAARAYLDRAQRFPVVAAFDGPRDLYFVTTQGLAADVVPLPARWAGAPGEHALRIRYAANQPPAVQLTEPSPDWTGFQAITMDVTNAADVELQLVLRILDAGHDWSHEDRFNYPFAIPAATRRTIRVPLEAVRSAPAGRPMDLARVANVMIFGEDPLAGGDLYVSRLWLE
jgi:hypothetical protein